ncbi:F-box only protein 22-like [Diadema antillarum]|uniref:F-box only protein 22-like n=1 Tax=Diadema antillarum TaxID=105358 RepID=UPI003A8409C5
MSEGVPGTDESIVDDVNGERSAWVMTELREVLKRTFSFLTARQLNVCARVCKVWHKTARRILARRQNIHWVVDFKSSHPKGQTSHPLGFFGLGLEGKLQSTDSQPKLALMFTEFSKGAEYRANGPSRKKTEDSGPKKAQEVVDFIRNLLPSDCILLSLMTPGTVAPTCSESTKPCDESESEGGALCALFPKLPGVEMSLLPVSLKLLQGGDKDTLWQRWQETGLSPTDTQCILLFGWGFTTGVQQAALELQRLFLEKAGRSPVIAGAIVNRLLSKGLFSRSEESSGVIGVMFSGPNVRAASVVLGEEVRQREDTRRAILRLKEANIHAGSASQSVGFMFACAGRGQFFYGSKNVESEEFHRVFPDTPLFGLFGGGEIGCENLSRGEKIDNGRLKSIAHAYTTIMCLVTFDPS